MHLLKLMKLMYLADRQSMKECGFSISDDRFVSMTHGPVLSGTLNLINGYFKHQQDWDELIDDRADHRVKLRRPLKEADRELLSPADCDVIDGIWQQFGGMDPWQIRDYTHQNCPEWQDPDGSSMPIDERDIFVALGVPEDQAKQLAAQIADQRHFHEMLSE